MLILYHILSFLYIIERETFNSISMNVFIYEWLPFIWAVQVSVVCQGHFLSTCRLLPTYYVTFFEVGDKSCLLIGEGVCLLIKVIWLTALFDKRSPDRLPNRCVHSVLHSEKTSHLFGDCCGPDAEKKVRRGCTPMLQRKCFSGQYKFKIRYFIFIINYRFSLVMWHYCENY